MIMDNLIENKANQITKSDFQSTLMLKDEIEKQTQLEKKKEKR